MSACCIYILELQNNKFYIGKSYDENGMDMRIKAHFEGRGSKWTRLYTPIKILDKYLKCHPREEDYLTKIYMDLHGIENVRGGAYAEIELPKDHLNILEMERRSTFDLCYECGEDHFVRECDERRKKIEKENIERSIKYIEEKGLKFLGRKKKPERNIKELNEDKETKVTRMKNVKVKDIVIMLGKEDNSKEEWENNGNFANDYSRNRKYNIFTDNDEEKSIDEDEETNIFTPDKNDIITKNEFKEVKEFKELKDYSILMDELNNYILSIYNNISSNTSQVPQEFSSYKKRQNIDNILTENIKNELCLSFEIMNTINQNLDYYARNGKIISKQYIIFKEIIRNKIFYHAMNFIKKEEESKISDNSFEKPKYIIFMEIIKKYFEGFDR